LISDNNSTVTTISLVGTAYLPKYGLEDEGFKVDAVNDPMALKF